MLLMRITSFVIMKELKHQVPNNKTDKLKQHSKND